jgi:putative membrane protein
MGYEWGWGSMIFGLIFLVIIGVIIYYFVISISHRENYSHHSYTQQPQYHTGRALEILKERYAKGEITKEQFNQLRRELES